MVQVINKTITWSQRAFWAGLELSTVPFDLAYHHNNNLSPKAEEWNACEFTTHTDMILGIAHLQFNSHYPSGI